MSSPLASLRSFSSSLPRLSTFTSAHEVAFPIPGKKPKIVTADKAFEQVKSGDHIFVQGISATPTPLLNKLCEHAEANKLEKITLHHLHLEGEAKWLLPQYKDRIRSNSLFTGHNLRKGVNDGTVDFNSCFLSEVPLLFRRRAIPLNVSIIHVSAPDQNGYCSLGTSVDATRAAITNSNVIIAMTNKNMPRTFGDSIIHESHIDVLVECNDHQLHQRSIGAQGEQEKKIGKIIAEQLVDNGATLQMGIGAIPDAALAALTEHRDIGIHTEMFSDGVLSLIEKNVITNRFKTTFPGKLTVSFVYGSTKLYNFLHDNPLVHFGDVQWVNDPAYIRKMSRMTAINSAVEVDLTGQIVSDSVGRRFLSGFGGQVDFLRGAAIADDGLGRPIIAIPAITKKGQSKIVPYIQEGAGVVTTRAHAHYIVTEYDGPRRMEVIHLVAGIAQLWGRNMRQRAYELIQIAHPDARAGLEKAAFDRMKVMPSRD